MPRSYSESTQVGFRIRGIEPPDLDARYPEATRKLFWSWVVAHGLKRKDYELSKGWNKNGAPMKRLTARSIKYRKSEVGPTDKHAPPLEPAHAASRVRSLLIGRPHTNSAEFWWGFDSVSGESFARILRAQRERFGDGRDVFGLSERGIEWVRVQAWRQWEQWKQTQHAGTPAQQPRFIGRQLPRYEVPKREIKGRMDLENFDLAGSEDVIRRAIEAGRFPGFRRLNARGEQWRPGTGLPPAPGALRPAPKPIPITPATVVIPVRERLEELAAYARNLGVPSAVSTKEEFIKALPGPWAEGALGAWDPHSGKLYFNLGSEAWVDPKAYFEKMRKANWLTDPTPAGFIHHEIGHSRLYDELVRRLGRTEGEKRFQAMLHDTFQARDPEHKLRERIRRLVSRMAAMNTNEFVAEVHSGLMVGRIYPADIMELYDAFGGVRP